MQSGRLVRSLPELPHWEGLHVSLGTVILDQQSQLRSELHIIATTDIRSTHCGLRHKHRSGSQSPWATSALAPQINRMTPSPVLVGPSAPPNPRLRTNRPLPACPTIRVISHRPGGHSVETSNNRVQKRMRRQRRRWRLRYALGFESSMLVGMYVLIRSEQKRADAATQPSGKGKLGSKLAAQKAQTRTQTLDEASRDERAARDAEGAAEARRWQ